MPRLSTSHSVLVYAPMLLGKAFAAIGPVADLVIQNRVVSPDGFTRSASLVGDQVIGPLIVGNKGENFRLNVIDNLSDPEMLLSTSIHWHGLLQKTTAWADGAAFVTQCPIIQGDSFLYNFDVPDQAGTFWYHSHLSTQYCDGVRGVFVVYDPNDPFANLYDIDDESTVITLADWYHKPSTELELPKHDSTLINGRGRWKDSESPTPLAVITVEQGKRYRMRVVNVACQPDYEFWIENHDMLVIEADGINHQPVQADKFRIFAAQRYSFVLNANQPVGNYWIRADPSSGDNGFNLGINSAILRYVGAPDVEPIDRDFDPQNELKESDLHPLEDPGAPGQPFPGGVDHAINLHFSTSSDRFFINDVSFMNPPIDILLQVLSGARTAGELLPPGSIYELPGPNKTIEISFTGGGIKGFEHPIHLHGHAFDVVRVAGSNVYNFENPVRRDTVNSGKGGDNVTIRFVTDNPGPWFLHCHIDWHLETGFAAVMAERTPEWQDVIHPPVEWFDVCPKYNALPPDQQ